MKLKSISFSENYFREGLNPWKLDPLSLGKLNLIVGRNSTGKSRIINVIHNLARHIQQQLPVIFKGEWDALFSDECDQEINYIVRWDEGKVVEERIVLDGLSKLERSSSSAKLYSDLTSSWQDISPPNDRLVLHVRRDRNEFPFLESLVSWASGVRGFGFANTSPQMIEIPGNPSQLTSLNAVPSVLDQLSEIQLKKVLGQLESMGYNLESVSTSLIPGMSPNLKMILLKENGIAYPLKQFEISQGMFRALSLLIIFEFLRLKNNVVSILLDDFGEGLDFDRSKKLAEIIFKDDVDSPFQVIATTNDSFLMNSIQLSDLTICYRSSDTVKCLNYLNSKKKFNEWRQLGLNNFDLFSSNYLLDN